MSADRDRLFAEALDEALATDEIRSAVRAGMIEYADLRSAVHESSDAIWNTFQGSQPSEAQSAEQRYSVQELKYTLLYKGILPFLRNRINEIMQAESSNILQLRNLQVSGLSQTADPVYDIRTMASTQLERLIGGLDGGIIAISGPPGAGKSTLLRSPVVRPVPQREPFLAEFINVRAEDPRGFLLSLLEALCRRIADPRYVKELDELLDPISFWIQLKRRERSSDRLFPSGLSSCSLVASLLRCPSQM